MNVASAARPHYFRLFQSIGNVTGGVKRICSMRADALVRTKVIAFFQFKNFAKFHSCVKIQVVTRKLSLSRR